jgi:ribosome maturation factor RimP
MTADINKIVSTTTHGLGYELVDFERTGGGLLRVFIDKVGGITVEDCAAVSNQLTRVFMVENIDFERLEVSSPGLDRPLKTLEDFVRFSGVPVKVRLNAVIDDRKRFDAVVEAVAGEKITFKLLDDGALNPAKAKVAKGLVSSAKSKAKQSAESTEARRITVALHDIEKAKLIPEV